MRWLLLLGSVSAAVAALPAQAQSGMTPAERAELESLRQRMAQLEQQVAARARTVEKALDEHAAQVDVVA